MSMLNSVSSPVVSSNVRFCGNENANVQDPLARPGAFTVDTPADTVEISGKKKSSLGKKILKTLGVVALVTAGLVALRKGGLIKKLEECEVAKEGFMGYMQKAGDYLAKGCDKVASWTIDPLMKLFRKGEAAVEEGAATVEAAAEEVASAAPVA